MKKDFNEFRFDGLNYRRVSNNYITCDRVSQDENKIVVKVADSHLIQTHYGYALILDHTHVVFLKDWAVSSNYYGNEVLLTREYFNVKEWGEHEDFITGDLLTFDAWLEVAKEQRDFKEIDEDGYEIRNEVKWEDGKKAAKKAFNRMMFGY